MRDRQPDLYLRSGGGDRLQPRHVVTLLAVLAVLYVAGAAFLSLLR